MDHYRTAHFNQEGLDYAIPILIKELTDGMAPPCSESVRVVLGESIEALEALPNRSKLDKLRTPVREVLEKRLCQIETKYQADIVIKLINEKYPDISK